MSEHDELTEQVVTVLNTLYGSDWSNAETIIALVRVDERTRLREALMSQEWDGPIHKAMSTWVACEFLYRQNNEGEPTHEAAMAFAAVAMEAALAAIGLTEVAS